MGQDLENSSAQKIKIFAAYNKQAHIFRSEVFQPIFNGAIDFGLEVGTLRDNTGLNISDKNINYGELTGHYWIWKNFLNSTPVDYIGFCQFHRFLDFNITQSDKTPYFKIPEKEFKKMFEKYSEKNILKCIEGYDVVLSNKILFKESVYEHYIKYHPQKDLDFALEILEEIYPQYINSAQEFMSGNQMHMFGCFVMKKECFDDYMTWLFDILTVLEQRADWKDYDNYNLRTPAFIAERFLNIWLQYKIKTENLQVLTTTSVMLDDSLKTHLKTLLRKL